MRVTIETVVDDETAERFLALYRASFEPLEAVAAARQSHTDDEFRDEMREPSVLKFIGWDRRERPVAMVVIHTDLDTVPWASPAFWRQRYPEQAARGAIFYFGALLVSPDVRGGPWAHRMLSETVRYTARNHAVAAFDCCQHNVEAVQLPRMIADVANALSYVDTERVDEQVYYAYVTHGLRDEIDLRDEPAAAPEPRTTTDALAAGDPAAR